MKNLLRIAPFITMLLMSSTQSFAGDTALRPVILELYTSQGCSSCPPADRVLKDYVENAPDVLALSMHVDYWNYIGWKDPFSSAQITQRQRDYSSAMRRRGVYTPQMVIDGQHETTGSRKWQIDSMIRKAKSNMVNLPISVHKQDGMLNIEIASYSLDKVTSADILLIGYDTKHITSIKRGENAGDKLENLNVVRQITKIGTYNGQDTTLTHPALDTENSVVIIQESGQQRIISALIL